jgi:hypothetical protein
MRTWISAIAVALCLSPVTDALANSKQCFSEQKIVWISAGHVALSKGPDGGDAVYFKLENGATYPLAGTYNLDWPRGQALHRTLLAALSGRFRISGYDHNGTMCDDIDEIYIHG